MGVPIVYIDHSRIRPGKLSDVRHAIDELVPFIEEREPQLLHYGFYVDDATSRMTVIAVHPDPASVELHLDVGGSAFRGFAELIEMEGIEIYGPTSDRMLELLKEKAAMLGDRGSVVVSDLYSGFARVGRPRAAEFDALMIQARAALEQIVNGNPEGYKALYSSRDDITLGNPFGGFGRGSEEVYEQLERAASYYLDGEIVAIETVARSVDADMAYTVEIERVRAKVGGQSHTSDVAIRVTCVYRRETDGWRIVHRHADPRVERQSADSVIHD